MLIGMVLFWVLVIGLIVWLVASGRGREPHPGAGPGPMEILDRRFAEGSISAEEYAERRRVLEEHRGSGRH